MVSGEIFHLALHWLFGGSKWPFSATRCKHHLIFRTPLRAVAGTLEHLFGPTSAGCTAKGGVSTSTTCSVAVIEVHQPKLLSRDLNFAAITYRSHGPSASWSTPFMCGCYFLSVLGPWWRGITRAGTLCFVVNHFVYLLARLHTFLD